MKFPSAKLLSLVVLACPMLPALGHAQGPSPAARIDTTRPQYDTETPQYDVSSVAKQAPNTVVAEVDGKPITLGQVGDAIRGLPIAIAQRPFDTLFVQARQELIQRQALVIRAHQTGVDEDPAVQRQVQAAANRILSDAYLVKELNAQITEQKLLDTYKDVVAGKPGPEEVRFRLILVATEREAADAIKEIQGGTAFAVVANRISKDPTSVRGGEVAFASRDGLLPEIGSVAFAMAPGQMAPYPVRAAGAWYVVKTEERRRAEAQPFAVVRGLIVQALQREGVAGVIAEAMSRVTVHEFTIGGKEVSAGKP
ncbi:MAG: peptidylprolyl isomerase [Rhodospirillales bacterium]